MSLVEYTRSPASIALLVDFGRESGRDAATLLRGSKLSERQLTDPNAEVSASQELQVLTNLLRVSKASSTLGLVIGLRYKPSVYGVWGFGLMSCATLGAAVSQALKFLPLTFAFSSIRYRLDGGLAHLQFDEASVEKELKAFLLNRDMSAALALLKGTVGGRFRLAEVRLKQPRCPGHADALAYSHAFGIEPVFGSADNVLIFDAQFLDCPLPLANPSAALMCEQMCTELLEKRRSRLGTAAIVNQYLGLNLNKIPQLGDMAGLLNTSERTLKRMLSNEGTTFRELVKQFQCGQSTEYLRNSNLSINEIAARLGFSDASSFSQSFKRWTGMAPLVYRESQADCRQGRST
jgi:AraC-like DNA-binding protein